MASASRFSSRTEIVSFSFSFSVDFFSYSGAMKSAKMESSPAAASLPQVGSIISST